MLITKYESAKKEGSKVIENNGSEQEAFYFPGSRGGLHWTGNILFETWQVEESLTGRMDKGPEAGKYYHPTWSRSFPKPSKALSAAQYTVYTIATVIRLRLFSVILRRQNYLTRLQIRLFPFSPKSSCFLLLTALIVCPSIFMSLSCLIIA